MRETLPAGLRCAWSGAAHLGAWLIVCLMVVLSGTAAAGAPGSYLVGEYKLPALADPSVAKGVTTELWAVVYRPRADGHYPLLVFLHGNHGTCGRYDEGLGIRIDDGIDYTYTGTCPEGWQPTPNHLGYGYLAADLAARGYVVVSINANRGVNAADGVRGDLGLNLRRGRLVLRHLQQLADWSVGRVTTPASLGFSLQGLIDFSHVGLLGHSRGGEGMRAALAQYRDRSSPWPRRIGPVNVEALFEIGPVDGQTGRTLDAEGVAWNVLLPGCDGDVYDLEGVRPFDRMVMRSAETVALSKSSIEVFGANHNFYNTEWQESDSQECPGQPKLFPDYVGSEVQRRTAQETVVPFFLAHVGGAKESALAERFDPSRPLPAELAPLTYYARGQAASLSKAANFIIDDFTRTTGRSSRGARNIAYRLTEYSHGDAGYSHDLAQRAALVAWNSAGAYLQVNASNKYVSARPGVYKSLEFRVKLECHDDLCAGNINPAGDVDFSISLVSAGGGLSLPVRLSSVASVYRPVGADSTIYGDYNSVFQTVRIPLQSFVGADLNAFQGVRFTFDATPQGRLSFGNVRFVQAEAANPEGTQTSRVATPGLPAERVAQPVREGNAVVAIRRSASVQGAGVDAGTSAGPDAREIELTSTRSFRVTNALPLLYIGDRPFTLSRFAGRTTDRIIFSISSEEYRLLPSGADVKLVIGRAPVWHFGRLRKP
ncbi:hypothetical protein [Aestuariivirga sp.]|uniref:hypothetical protein n=1 Tax=Aestuariivirga sp. TaxID=2650926 RepID=UPI003017A1D6